MARLQSELQRLYFPNVDEPRAIAAPGSADAMSGRMASLIDPEDRVRAMILELGSPANWEPTSAVWRGVQRELDLPAPAIAVSGLDGFQLWFSLAEAVTVSQAHAFLNALKTRFLPDLAARHIRLMPAAEPSAPQSLHHQAIVPALQDTGNWSAFVSADLAPIFVDTPWLDITPSDEGQADLLRSIRSIKRPEWEAAQEQLGLLTVAPIALKPEPPVASPALNQATAMACSAHQDPRQFLQKVMNDEAAPLALRIESAKALLQYPDGRDASPHG